MQTLSEGEKMANKSRMRKGFFVAGMILFLSSQAVVPAFAWTPYGHMVIAYRAYQHLTPKTKERVVQLLSLNPYYETWKKQIGPVKSQDELEMKVFMLAAAWPDMLKGDKSYTADGTMGGFRPKGPAAGQNIGYQDKQLHMYWHFYDQPFSNDKSALPAVPAPNAETQIKAFRSVIASDAADELKSYDLTWLLHMVGDIHQPLHSVTRISNKYPEGDNGGNFVKVKCPDCPSNLHAFWDVALGTTADPKAIPDASQVIETASHLSAADKKSSNDLDVEDWVSESSRLAKNAVYKPLGKGNGPFELSDKYRRRTKEISQTRGELAAERLANVLNEELK